MLEVALTNRGNDAPMEAFLSQIGLSMSDLFAGFAGGVVAALVVSGPRPSIWAIISSVVVGALAGGYLGPIAPLWFPHWMGTKPSPAVSFGVGVAGLPICKGLMVMAQRLRWSGHDGAGRNG